ncbi:MAG: helix-turn-helix domain-containing protein [Thermoguttaceae bacterium]|nr:helix-turn-helix domain-containing protein [Thermoguttaceae bacterium]
MKRRNERKVTTIPPEPALLTIQQLADYLNVSYQTIRTFHKGGMPAELKVKKIIRFDRRKCLEWIQKNC